ncbi:hypothetical protein NUM3379_08890 [Kineococcus sp. NUM-3379]
MTVAALDEMHGTPHRTTAAPHHDPRRVHRRLASVAGAVLAASTLGTLTAAPAHAAGRLTLQDQGGRWTLTGAGFTPGPASAQVWVMLADTWTRHEHQSGIQVTRSVISPYFTFRGGTLAARGRQHWFPGSGLIGPHWADDNPLRCGQPYQAVTHTPADGYVFSNVLTTPCPPLH